MIHNTDIPVARNTDELDRILKQYIKLQIDVKHILISKKQLNNTNFVHMITDHPQIVLANKAIDNLVNGKCGEIVVKHSRKVIQPRDGSKHRGSSFIGVSKNSHGAWQVSFKQNK